MATKFLQHYDVWLAPHGCGGYEGASRHYEGVVEKMANIGDTVILSQSDTSPASTGRALASRSQILDRGTVLESTRLSLALFGLPYEIWKKRGELTDADIAALVACQYRIRF